MPPLGLPAIGFHNLLVPTAGVVVAASSSVPGSPATNVLSDHLARRWQGVADGTADWLKWDVGGITPIGYVALIGTNLTATAPVRVRAWQAVGDTVNQWDTGTIAAFADPSFGGLFVAFPPGGGTVNARYIQVDVPDRPNPEIAAGTYVGRAACGPLLRLAHGYASVDLVFEHRSTVQEPEGGQWYVNPRRPRRGFRVSFPRVTLDQVWGGFEELNRICADHTDILFCRDMDSPNLSRDTIWGILKDGPVDLGQGQPYTDFMAAEMTVWERMA